MTELEYYATVDDLAIDAINQAVENGNGEDYHEHIGELVDSSSFIIYPYQNKKVLEYTRNEEAYIDDYGVQPEDFEHGIPWAKFAYCAMEADVREKAERILQDRRTSQERGQP
jgi:hypothetical protein